MAVETCLPHHAQRSRGRDVTVDEVLYLTQVVDEKHGTPRGYIDLQAVGLSLCQGVNG